MRQNLSSSGQGEKHSFWKKYEDGTRVGGGAVLFDVLSNFRPKEVLINDINGELTNCYIQIKNNVSKLIKLLSVWQEEYQNSNLEERKKKIYRMRD